MATIEEGCPFGKNVKFHRGALIGTMKYVIPDGPTVTGHPDC